MAAVHKYDSILNIMSQSSLQKPAPETFPYD